VPLRLCPGSARSSSSSQAHQGQPGVASKQSSSESWPGMFRNGVPQLRRRPCHSLSGKERRLLHSNQPPSDSHLYALIDTFQHLDAVAKIQGVGGLLHVLGLHQHQYLGQWAIAEYLGGCPLARRCEAVPENEDMGGIVMCRETENFLEAYLQKGQPPLSLGPT